MGNLNMSQTEIDALLTGLASGKPVPRAPSAKKNIASKASSTLLSLYEPVVEGPDLSDSAAGLAAGINAKYRLYDFRRPEKLSKDHNRLLRAHFGLFWRRVSNYLANLARCSVEVSLLEVDQTSYGEIFVSHGVPMLMCTVRLAGEYHGMLKMNLSQIFCLVDRLMGGSGAGSTRPRALTEFERNLCFDLFGNLLSFYAATRQIEEFQVENIETDERLLPRTLSGDELMVRAIYDVRIGNHNGYLNLYLPMRFVTPILAGVSSTIQNRRNEGRELSPTVSKLRLPVKVILGEASLPASKIASLKPGTLLSLEQEQDKPLKVEVGPLPRFLARPGLVGNKLAISIVGRWETQ